MTNQILDTYKVLSTRQVLHRADTQGTVVTQVDEIEFLGQRHEIKFWREWSTGTLVRVDSRVIN